MASVPVVGCGASGAEAPRPPSRANLPPVAAKGSQRGCRVSLSERTAPLARPAPPAPSADTPSQLLVQLTLPLSRLRRELEAHVPRQLARRQATLPGVAGALKISVDRGPLAISVQGDDLVVQTELRADVQACWQNRCDSACAPTATARVALSSQLDPSYRFGRPRASAHLTRGCKLRVLGGFVTIDVTKSLRAELSPVLRQVERDVARQLPDLRPHAERLWRELTATRQLPLAGCLVPQPTGIVQGPVADDGSALRFRFAVLARPELRARCGQPHAPSPLPPLAHDPSLPPDGELRLGTVVPLARLASALEASGGSVVSDREVRVREAHVVATREAVDVDLSLAGDVCGELALRSSLAVTPDGSAVVLDNVRLAAGEQRRLGEAGVAQADLVRGLVGATRVALPLRTVGLAGIVERLVASASTEELEVSAKLREIAGDSAQAREDALVAWLRLSGNLELEWRGSPDPPRRP